MERECCVRGYHVYIDVWDAAIGEELDCQREPSNANDRYAVAVVKSGVVVSHLPKKLSRIYSLFMRRGATWQGGEDTLVTYHKEEWRALSSHSSCLPRLGGHV